MKSNFLKCALMLSCGLVAVAANAAPSGKQRS